MGLISPSLIANAIQAAKAVLPLVPMGGEALAAGSAIVGVLNDLRETAGASPELIGEFEASREALERAVNAHADKTAASLGDG